MRITIAIAAAALSTLLAVPTFAAEHAVRIVGFKFEPANISVAVGDTITFTNEDGAPHTATATDGSFDTGRLDKGQSATVTINKAGELPYICDLHPMMKGQVTAQ